MLPGFEKLSSSDRITRLAKLLSSAHRVLDGQPGRIIYEGESIDYDLVLPDEMQTQKPVMFRVPEDMQNDSLVAWLNATPANYRFAHNLLSSWLGAFYDETGSLHAVQKLNVATRLWKTPYAMKYGVNRETLTPFPANDSKPSGSFKRVIRDR